MIATQDRTPMQPPRIDYPQALRPVTVSQVLKAERSTSDNRTFYINGASCNTVQLVAEVVGLDVMSQKFYLEDGTRGRIKAMPFSGLGDDHVTESMSRRFVRVTASINQYKGHNFLTYRTVREVQDPHEIFFHLTNVIYTTTVIEKGSPGRVVSSQPTTTSNLLGTAIDGVPESWDEDRHEQGLNAGSATIIHRVPSTFVSPSAIPEVRLASPRTPTAPNLPLGVTTPPQGTQTNTDKENENGSNEQEEEEEEDALILDDPDMSYDSAMRVMQTPPRVRWEDFIASQVPPTPIPPTQPEHDSDPGSSLNAQDGSAKESTEHDDTVPFEEILRASEPVEASVSSPPSPRTPVIQELARPISPVESPPSSPLSEEFYSPPPSPVLSMPGEFPATPSPVQVSAPLPERRARNDSRAELGYGEHAESISASLPRNRARRLSRDPYNNLTSLQRDIITTIHNARDEAGISSHLYPRLLRRFQREVEWEGVPVCKLVEAFQRHSSPAVPQAERIRQFQVALEDLLARNYIKTARDNTHFTVVEDSLGER